MSIFFNKIINRYDKNKYLKFHSEISFSDYLEMVKKNPKLIRTSHQMVFDMIISKGSSVFERYRKKYTHYNFFDIGEYAIFGLEEPLDRLVKFIRGAASGYGTDKRLLLLNGPVGSSKSTIARCLKKGLEEYSKSDEGAWYTFRWVNLPTGAEGIYTSSECDCPMHEEPLRLIPADMRKEVVSELNDILKEQNPDNCYSLKCEGELDPKCRKILHELLDKNGGDLHKVLENHIRVVRKLYSEADRVGIATFQPKDEKSQDSSELTGDIDWSKLSHFGSDSNALAFSFDGELCVANRGVVEMIEMLKLTKEFLYDLLGATQEQQIKPRKFSQIHIDEMIISHSNLPDFQKLVNDKSMEAFKDRTVKINVPYVLRWSDEIKVLERDYGPGKIKQHIAPHTLEIASLWAILTRIKDDKDGKLDLIKKARLYNGEALPGFTEDNAKELMDKYPEEGIELGVSVRYVQEKISNCLSEHSDYINFFMVMNEIREGLNNSSLITDKEAIARYHTCTELVIEELGEILKNEVRRALVGDEKTIERLCHNYIDNLMAYIKKSKIRNKLTNRDEVPNEKLMRSIETKIGISDAGVNEFRRSIASFIGDTYHSGKEFKWDTSPELKKALEAKLFEDVKSHIKLSTLSEEANIVQPDIQEKIDAIKHRLIEQYGYNDRSATDVLEYVGSLFNSGASEEE